MNRPTQIKKISALLEELEKCFQRKAKIEQLAAGALEDDFDIDIEMNIRNKEEEKKELSHLKDKHSDTGMPKLFFGGIFEVISQQKEEIENLQSQLTYHQVLPDTTALQVLGILIHGIDSQINQLTAQLESYGVNIKMK